MEAKNTTAITSAFNRTTSGRCTSHHPRHRTRAETQKARFFPEPYQRHWQQRADQLCQALEPNRAGQANQRVHWKKKAAKAR
jgi:hypothetical protein